jgi:hypothetical protein
VGNAKAKMQMEACAKKIKAMQKYTEEHLQYI